jgi:hypothetical protein
MSNTNPITPVRDSLWTLLEANTAFTTLVPVGNRIKLSDAPKRGAQFSDFPCVTIEPNKGLTVKDWTNTDADLRKIFRVKIATGDGDPDKQEELEWVIFVALKDWETTMAALSWNGHTGYVKHCGVYDQEETLRERDLTVTETGWATVWEGECWLSFPHGDIVVGPA